MLRKLVILPAQIHLLAMWWRGGATGTASKKVPGLNSGTVLLFLLYVTISGASYLYLVYPSQAHNLRYADHEIAKTIYKI